MSTHEKIIFQLERDEDGYPPVDYEGVWALRLGDNTFQVDNIPFFASISMGDIVQALDVGNEFRYMSTISYSGNSLIRVVYFPETDPNDVRRELEHLGCETELDEGHALIAVNVPPEADLSQIQEFLSEGEEGNRWGYEEAILRNEA